MNNPTLLWFRQDLRLRDNPALQAALHTGRPVIPIFIWCPDEEAPWSPGAASRWWLHHSLEALAADLRRLGSRLILRRGAASKVLDQLRRETGARAVCWNHRYEPVVLARDSKIHQHLLASGVDVRTFHGAVLFEPGSLLTQAGKPFQVFTPFWKAALSRREPAAPAAAPDSLAAPSRWPASERLDAWMLKPRLSWADGFGSLWKPGERGARARLDRFLEETLWTYAEGRNFPAQAGSSRLSPHLHFGEISPGDVWHNVQRRAAQGCARGQFQGAEIYLKEIGWREFASHLLYHFPHTAEKPLHPAFEKFPWDKNPGLLKAWQQGRTGYALVDAGMRELWTTGWMHNRVRMIAASFLVKDLRMSWLEGARWFWETLVDADLASNTLGWQWAAGCGADAAPYFRIFNPSLQAKRFDPAQTYVRRWVPETGTSSYPPPIVDHLEARNRALLAFRRIKPPG